MRSIIAWFADNGVAANLLMALIAAVGLLSVFTMTQEVFPEFSADILTVTVPYPGAAPEEVEEGIVVRIEEAIQDLEGIKEIRSSSSENVASVIIELMRDAEAREVLNDVKSRVDAIDTFPDEAEEPVIEEIVLRRQVLEIAISGATDERSLKQLGERIRDDVSGLPGITQVELVSARPYEISIEVSEDDLRRYGLTFDGVANAVRSSSLDLPGGRVEARSGEILLRTEGQVYRGDEFERLPLKTLADGTRITVGDVARVVDGFADTDQNARFDGQPAVIVQIFRVGDQSALGVAATVKRYVEKTQATVPEGIQLTVWQDQTVVLRSRLDTLKRNGRAGFALVFLVLALFLRLRLAGWVSLGIPISFLGALAMMPTFDVTINLISLFAFIVVLGIVVDDAIIVGENIYTHYQRGKERLAAAVDGAHEVSKPVIFAVLTSIAAFAPLLVVEGYIGKIMRVIPVVVIAALVFSLIESLLVLPNHLSHLRHEGERKTRTRLGRLWRDAQERFSLFLEWVIERSYRPSLARALRWRYVTLAVASVMLMLTFGVVRGGWIKFDFLPPVEADYAASFLTLPQGTPVEVTAEYVTRIERAALELEAELEEELGGRPIRHAATSVGDQPFRTQQNRTPASLGGFSGFSASHLGEVTLELAEAEERNITSTEITDRWREKVGPIPDAVELVYSSSLFSSGEAINIELSGPSMDDLRTVATRLKEGIASYPGVQDLTDSYRAGKKELEIHILPEAEATGLTQLDLARQVRQAFYGEEAQRIQRGRDDVKVMVRYPEAERRSLGNLEELRIRTPGGVEVPFTTAAEVEMSRGPASIARKNRQRVLNVTADVDLEEGNAGEILADLERSILPSILADYPGVRYDFVGQRQEQRETMSSLFRGFGFALLMIYVLLAIPFRSYLQPLIVMSAIPFGLIGAIVGHVVMGMNLAILSMFGIVALTGVVVNDSLVMVDFINRAYRSGLSLHEAIREAGASRFRPIVLTSLTTFAGLTPLLLEKSVQAQFLIPMATSLAFGVLFATFITLLIVPSLYAILEDLRALFGHQRDDVPAMEPAPSAG